LGDRIIELELLFLFSLILSNFINISKPFSFVPVRISDVIYLFFIYWAFVNKLDVLLTLLIIFLSKLVYLIYIYFIRDKFREFYGLLLNFLLNFLPLAVVVFLVYFFSSANEFLRSFLSYEYLILFLQVFVILVLLYLLYLLVFNILDFLFNFGFFFSEGNYLFYDSIRAYLLSNVFNSVLFLILYDLSKVNIYLVFLFILALLPLGLASYNYKWILVAIYHTIERIADVVESKHIYGKGHSKNVAELCAKFAYKLGLNYDDITKLVHCARIMNVGYVSVPDYIFNKSSLDNYELQLIRKHPENIYNILQKMDIYKDIALIVKHHHESWDGSGYPDGLRGNSIPFLSRIIKICDVFLALTEERSFRKAYSINEALEIMNKEKSKFDPFIFEKFVEFVKEEFFNEDKGK